MNIKNTKVEWNNIRVFQLTKHSEFLQRTANLRKQNILHSSLEWFKVRVFQTQWIVKVFLNSLPFALFPLWPCINLILGTPTSCFKNGIGTRSQACAWAHANPMVVEHITLMTPMSDYRQQFIDFKFHDRLSIADAIVLVQFLGLTKAAAFISEVDPWCYPHDDTPSTLTVKKYVHPHPTSNYDALHLMI